MANSGFVSWLGPSRLAIRSHVWRRHGIQAVAFELLLLETRVVIVEVRSFDGDRFVTTQVWFSLRLATLDVNSLGHLSVDRPVDERRLTTLNLLTGRDRGRRLGLESGRGNQ